VVYLGLLKLPKMSKAEIDGLIEEQFLCRIACGGKLAPYIAPFQYVFMKGYLYFHFTDYGRKMGLLENDVSVCVEIEKYAPDLSAYSFVVLTGKLQVVAEVAESVAALAKMVGDAQRKQLSTNFLVAHGIPKEVGWLALTEDKPVIIVKLVKVIEVSGLKSP
jgi:nitroimidazol reductase NimA-like FMN-containing flavoprotein (pyridoxamine 5'-phosphate oxidase superfamily)